MQIIYPFNRQQILKLVVGEQVLISGRIFTGRDRLHRFLAENKKLPVNLRCGALYHCGPLIIRRRGQWQLRSAGPTTSIRTEAYMPMIIRRYGLSVIIGKGGMGPGTRQACAKYGCVYLHAVGGAAQILADKVARVLGVNFLDSFGSTEAMWELMVKDFPALVTIDARGNSLHEQVAARSASQLGKLLE